MPENDKQWRIDKHIPVAFIFAIFLQTAGALWWASKVDSTVDTNAKQIIELQEAVKENRQLYERIIRLEVMLERILDEIKSNATFH